jgi:hypothetical protein
MIGDTQERPRKSRLARDSTTDPRQPHRRGSTCPLAGLEDESQRRCSSRYHRRNGARNHLEPLIRTALLRTGERGTERDSGYHTKVIPSPGPPCATAGVSAYLRTCLLVPDYLSPDFSTPALLLSPLRPPARPPPLYRDTVYRGHLKHLPGERRTRTSPPGIGRCDPPGCS